MAGRQMQRIFEAEVARRNEPRVVAKTAFGFTVDATQPPAARLKPPQQREIVAVRGVPGEPETTLCAVAELVERDHEYEFTLFRHARTGEDGRRGKVLYLRRDGDYGLVQVV